MTINQEYRVAELQRGPMAGGSGRSFGGIRGLVVLHFAAGSVQPWRQRRMDRRLTQLAPYPTLLHRRDNRLPRHRLLARLSIIKFSCADGEACARPLPNRAVKTGLIVATVLVIAALGLDFLSPLFANP